jgi:hypothetical protein
MIVNPTPPARKLSLTAAKCCTALPVENKAARNSIGELQLTVGERLGTRRRKMQQPAAESFQIIAAGLVQPRGGGAMTALVYGILPGNRSRVGATAPYDDLLT